MRRIVVPLACLLLAAGAFAYAHATGKWHLIGGQVQVLGEAQADDATEEGSEASGWSPRPVSLLMGTLGVGLAALAAWLASRPAGWWAGPVPRDQAGSVAFLVLGLVLLVGAFTESTSNVFVEPGLMRTTAEVNVPTLALALPGVLALLAAAALLWRTPARGRQGLLLAAAGACLTMALLASLATFLARGFDQAGEPFGRSTLGVYGSVLALVYLAPALALAAAAWAKPPAEASAGS